MSYWDSLMTVLGVRAIQNTLLNRRMRKKLELIKTVASRPSPARDELGRWIFDAPAESTCCGGKQCQCKKSN